jgi:hypothetical protein
MSDAPHPFCCVTRREWKLAYAISFIESTDALAGAFGLAPFASPGYEGRTDDYVELLYRVARFLHHEHGYDLGSLVVGQGGSIASAGPVEPGNAMYVAMLRQGSLPDLPLLFREAIAFAEENIPSLPTEPFRAALAQTERDRAVAARLLAEQPEAMDARRRLRQEALGELGIVAVDGEVN